MKHCSCNKKLRQMFGQMHFESYKKIHSSKKDVLFAPLIKTLLLREYHDFAGA